MTSPDPLAAPASPTGIDRARAVLVDRSTLAWPPGLVPAGLAWSLELFSSPAGGMRLQGGEIRGGASLGLLAVDPAGLTAEQTEDRRHLRGHLALHPAPGSPAADPAVLADALRGQLLVGLRTAATPSDLATAPIELATGVQIAGILDDLWGRDAARREHHGVRVDRDAVHLALWAPTARSVDLLLFPGTAAQGDPEHLPMRREADGTWTITGPLDWRERAYLYEVEVYAPWGDAVVRHRVTDPCSVGLTAGSEASVIVDLADPRWMPAAWREAPNPVVDVPARRAITELHVRDFSIADASVPEPLRGTYAAFACEGTAGTAHLRLLAGAGLTTVHLLPTFDIASIPGRRADQRTPLLPAGTASDSPEPQAAIAEVASVDGFNWGYDPHHWSVPEASYAPDGEQDGGARTAQLRTMVGALHAMGLEVVLDQVFNHTFASGPAPTSVLDKVVPGYFHRLSECGCIETSTCCENVATEHAMAQRYMVDAVVTWARHYRIDGFRFDLMGHHTRANMLAVRAALDALTLERDGIDGRAIYLYGEGWDFGEVAGGARFDQAIQGMLGGTGIGCFNDRIRDAVHGGGPADADHRAEQGFGTGLLTDPSGFDVRSPEEQRAALGRATDLVALSMAGNLIDLELMTSEGSVRRGDELRYSGMPAAYGQRPEETVNYVDAHDNETLYDTLVWKLPDALPMEERIRMNILSLATVALGQSPSFWHAGTELLRSKSLDTDSYDSGDLFNAIDWTGATHGFGRGLPPASRNAHLWEAQAPLLRRADLVPAQVQILSARDRALDLLRVRRDTPLLTLGDAELIRACVRFPCAGPDAAPGLLVMLVDARGRGLPGPDQLALVVLNASPDDLAVQVPGLEGASLRLARALADGADDVVRRTRWESGTVRIPGRTAAVLVG